MTTLPQLISGYPFMFDIYMIGANLRFNFFAQKTERWYDIRVRTASLIIKAYLTF